MGAVISPHFTSWMNISNQFGQAMTLVILSLGQLIVIIAGGIDLSAGALMAASGVIGLKIMTAFPEAPAFGVGVMIAFGILIGFINASLVQKAKVNAFVVTIGMMMVLEGISLIVSPKPFGPSPKIFKILFNDNIAGIPAAFILLLILIAGFILLLKYTTLGRGFYAVGENKISSFNAGFKVNRVVYLSFILCSLMSVLAAVFLLGRSGAADPSLGPGLEFEAIACVLIGGATLAGGRGSIAGTICGVFVLNTLANILSLVDVQIWYQEVIRGIMLLMIIISYEKSIRKKIG
jgi:ribose transport system permease protein